MGSLPVVKNFSGTIQNDQTQTPPLKGHTIYQRSPVSQQCFLTRGHQRIGCVPRSHHLCSMHPPNPGPLPVTSGLEQLCLLIPTCLPKLILFYVHGEVETHRGAPRYGTGGQHSGRGHSALPAPSHPSWHGRRTEGPLWGTQTSSKNPSASQIPQREI